jgi:O-antigen ligase
LSVILPTALYSVLSLLGPEGLGWFFKGYQGDGFTFGNSTFAAMYIFGAFLMSIYYLYQATNKKWWMYILPIILVINPNILSRHVWLGDFSQGFVGEARASAYMIVFSVFPLFALWGISKIHLKKTKTVVMYSLAGFLLLVAGCSTFSLFSNDGFLRKIYLSQATAARPIVWEMSEKSIRQRPFFGWGTDNFERVFEINYDNRLLETKNGKEAWFDRAHNVFIDQAIDNGIVGLLLYILLYLVIVFSVIRTFLHSTDKNDIFLSSILLVYFPLHFIELQTAFDTTISYPMLASMISIALALNYRVASLTSVGGVVVKKTEWVLVGIAKHSVAVLFLMFFVWSFFAGWVPFVRTQIANGNVRAVGTSEKRIPLYKNLFGSRVDSRAFLWRTSTDFQRGIAENPKMLEQPQKVEGLAKEILVLENSYREYLKNNPKSFRERLNLADILIYQRLFGVDKLAEAQTILDESIALVPQSPQPYWMKAVGYIYMKKFELAREYAKKGLAINPNIEESQNIVAYVEDSIKNFPNLNLYFFTQI